jgi:GntR family transcriptional regulator
MFGKVDKHSGIPAYIQVIDIIKKEILLGNLKSEDQLPPVRELQEIFDVNVNTILKALERLQLEGIFESKHGVGYFVISAKVAKADVIKLLSETVEKLKMMDIDLNTAILIMEEVWKNDSKT